MNNLSKNLACYRIEDLKEGQYFSFSKKIRGEDLDAFAALSGDINPLHMQDNFAQSRGFSGRVVHGALLMSYLSQLLGVHFPGENCLVQKLSISFLSPAYVEDTIKLKAVIDQISSCTNTIVLKVTIQNEANDDFLVKGKAYVGFTQEGKRE